MAFLDMLYHGIRPSALDSAGRRRKNAQATKHNYYMMNKTNTCFKTPTTVRLIELLRPLRSGTTLGSPLNTSTVGLALISIVILSGCATQSSPSHLRKADLHARVLSDSDVTWAMKTIERRDQRTFHYPSNKEFIAALEVLDYGAPSQQEVAWANKIISLHDEEAEFAKQSDEFAKQQKLFEQAADRLAPKIRENRDLVDQIAKIQRDWKAYHEKNAWLAKNKERLENEVTAKGESTRQQRFESYDLSGEVISAFVDDVEMPEENILEFSKVFVWKTPTGGVGVARAEQEVQLPGQSLGAPQVNQ